MNRLFVISKNNLKLALFLVSVFLAFYIVPEVYSRYLRSNFHPKIWVHRVNSIEKYQEVQNQFSGVELDLVFDTLKNCFDINHPPEKSINLTLSEFLEAKQDYTNFGLWLDFKNLTPSNAQASLNRLDSLMLTFKINLSNVIVESPSPLLLKPFAEIGFKTSYYLPKNISELGQKELKTQINFVERLKTSKAICFISSNIRDYEFMKKYFPNTKIITWSSETINGGVGFKVLNNNEIKNVLKDRDVAVVLFVYNAKVGNR